MGRSSAAVVSGRHRAPDPLRQLPLTASHLRARPSTVAGMALPRLGRPSLEPYADRFDVPVADGPASVTFLGVATLLIDDGETQVLTDAFFSRPGLVRVGLRTIAPDLQRIDACLTRAGATRVAAVAPVHSHFDHALDAAAVAERTGALLVGGSS